MADAGEIRSMFARVAPRYDLANSLLSLGLDRRWRRTAVRFAGVLPGERALDVCSGTGDLARALAAAGLEVIGTDFCPEMLVRAACKRGRGGWRPRFGAADTTALPFGDGVFDLVSVAFGIRNVTDPLAGLREMRRVARPGGRVLVLEFCRPRVIVLGPLFLFYFHRILPRLGGWITGDRQAYAYLPASVARFPERQEFLALMREAGLQSPRLRLLTGGVAALYRGEVPTLAS